MKDFQSSVLFLFEYMAKNGYTLSLRPFLSGTKMTIHTANGPVLSAYGEDEFECVGSLKRTIESFKSE